MNTMLDITMGRPWALAFCIGVRDALDLDAAGVPKTACPASSSGDEGLSHAWRSWWESLLRRGATHGGFAALHDERDSATLLPADPQFRSAALPIIASVEEFVADWLAGENDSESRFQVGSMSPLAEGLDAAGFQTRASRRRSKQLIGRALPDDVVVAIVPVLGEWGHVTRFGSILISDSVAADAGLAERWFRTELWSARG